MKKALGCIGWFIFASVVILTLDIIRADGVGYLADFFVAFTAGILATMAIRWAYEKVPDKDA